MAADGTGNTAVTLSTGTYDGIAIVSPNTLADLLDTEKNCAYYQNGRPLALEGLGNDTSLGTVLTGSVTVAECKHEDVKPTSNNNGTHTLNCPYCGYTVEAENCSYGEYTTDATSHWHECACGDKSDAAAHTEDGGSITKAPTETEKGARTYKCSICGYVIRTKDIEKLPSSHMHSYGTDWKSDSNSHWHECTCGDRSGGSAHTEDGRSVTKAPTETEKGVRTYKCSVCGYVMRTEEIEKLPPSHTESSQPGDKKPNNSNQPNNENTGGNQSGNPDGGNTEDTKADVEIPFIKDEDGKNGWDVIRAEEEKAEEGSIINIDMNGSTVVPGDIFNSIKDRNITITFDMGNGIIWSVNGKNVITNKANDMDFSVKTGTNTIPVDIVNNVTGERYSIQISLAYEGEFGFTAILSINLGKENAGLTANLYYYNESTGELEFICADTITKDGTVSFTFTHASDYMIAIGAYFSVRKMIRLSWGGCIWAMRMARLLISLSMISS